MKLLALATLCLIVLYAMYLETGCNGTDAVMTWEGKQCLFEPSPAPLHSIIPID